MKHNARYITVCANKKSAKQKRHPIEGYVFLHVINSQ